MKANQTETRGRATRDQILGLAKVDETERRLNARYRNGARLNDKMDEHGHSLQQRFALHRANHLVLCATLYSMCQYNT